MSHLWERMFVERSLEALTTILTAGTLIGARGMCLLSEVLPSQYIETTISNGNSGVSFEERDGNG